MLDHLDLNKLSVFRELAEAKSFTKAAQNLKQPKSRVSRTITSLEKELGVQLIYRTTRSFQLTQAGTLLLTEIRPILNDLSNSLEKLISDTNEIAGQIRLTTPDDIASELLSGICQEFMEMNPKIQIKIFASNSVMDMVKDHFDLAIRIGKPKDSSLIQRRIGNVNTEIVMTPEMYQKYKPKKIEDLAKIPWLAYEDLQGKPQLFKMIKGKDSKSLKMNPKFACNNFFMLRAMALKHAGFMAAPSFLVKNAIMKGELVPLFRDWKSEELPLHVLIPQQKEVPLRIRKFLDYLVPKLMPYF